MMGWARGGPDGRPYRPTFNADSRRGWAKLAHPLAQANQAFEAKKRQGGTENGFWNTHPPVEKAMNWSADLPSFFPRT